MQKFLKVFSQCLKVAPYVLADIEGTVQKVQADPNVAQKVEDGMTAALDGLESLGKLFGL